MRRAIAAVFLLSLGVWALVGQGARVAGGQEPPAAVGFAVLELYTSEGCSSCPPADQLLGELATDYAGRPVYPLSFHVDYWNDLGWQDRYSDSAFSRRQRQYATALGRHQVYTPQLVINGRNELIGSHGAAARGWIERALAMPSAQTPAITLAACAAGQRVEVRARSERAPPSAQLALLLVQRVAQSRVTRGENADLTLRHSNVVRALSYTSPAQASVVLQRPRDLEASQLSVVALLEDPLSHAVLAAARTLPVAPCALKP